MFNGNQHVHHHVEGRRLARELVGFIHAAAMLGAAIKHGGDAVGAAR
jgi:hypothetical protein